MQNWSGFGSLDLSNVEAEQGRKTLTPGEHLCRIAEASIEDAKAGGGKYLKIDFQAVSGAGGVTDRITVVNKNADAVRIGLSRLKALLEAAGHPNPNRPGDIKSLVGLQVGVHVEQSEDWIDDKGEKRKGGGKPRQYGAYFKPGEAASAGGVPQAGQTNGKFPFNDPVPF